MPLNKSKGNMYDFVTHTWNTIKGKCYLGCSYCYMMRWGELKPVREDKSEYKTDLGKGNFIFVGSSCDMFADDIPLTWILNTFNHMAKYPDNKYLLQSKNPERILDFIDMLTPRLLERIVVCATIESDMFYPDIMGMAPHPVDRSIAMQKIAEHLPTYVTIEPVMDFHLEHFVRLIRRCKPEQVNIGADSGGHNLPEPPREKLQQLISEIEQFTTIHNKKNLTRLL